MHNKINTEPERILWRILNNHKMTTYKIAFNDAQENEVYSITNKTFEDLAEATRYAELVLDNTSDDCIYFTIYEI